MNFHPFIMLISAEILYLIFQMYQTLSVFLNGFLLLHFHIFCAGLPFQKNIQQENTEAGSQSQVQTDGQQTSQSPPSPEVPAEENKIPSGEKVSVF